MPFIIQITPDPHQLAEAKRQGAQDALSDLICVLRERLDTCTALPDLNPASPIDLGSSLARLLNTASYQAAHAAAELQDKLQLCQWLETRVKQLEASLEAQHLRALQRNTGALQAQLATVTAERDKAREQCDHQSRQCDLKDAQIQRLEKLLIQTNEQLKRQKPG